jgi:hypothetical protein
MAGISKVNIVETTPKMCGKLKSRPGYRTPILSRYDRTRQQRQELFMNVETRSSQSVQFNKDAHTEGKRYGNSLPAVFLLSFLIILPLTPISAWCAVQTPPQVTDPAPATQTTLAIFTDPASPGISDSLWTALVAALNQELASGSSETKKLLSHATDHAATQGLQTDVAAPINIVRGNDIAPGIVLDNSISVYIHGKCVAMPRPRPEPISGASTPAALGWVRIHNGSIEPFIHVECTQISRVLGLQGMGLKGYQRDQLMAGAIARVVLHEWIHISTQSSHHSKNGITRAQFSLTDLLVHLPKSAPKQEAPSAADQGRATECSKLSILDSSAKCRLRGTK